jgi:hypothetical protein
MTTTQNPPSQLGRRVAVVPPMFAAASRQRPYQVRERCSDTSASANGGCVRLGLLEASLFRLATRGPYSATPCDAASQQRGSLGSPLGRVLLPSVYRYAVWFEIDRSGYGVSRSTHRSKRACGLPHRLLPWATTNACTGNRLARDNAQTHQWLVPMQRQRRWHRSGNSVHAVRTSCGCMPRLNLDEVTADD